MTSQHGVTDAAVIEYFARVLQRGQLDEVTFGDDRFVAVPRADLRLGCLPQEKTDKLFSRKKTKAPIPVVVSLLSLQIGGGKHSGLVLLAASLRPDGTLDPVVETGSSPWIPAERLNSPQVTGREVMLGDQEAFWSAFHGPLSAEVSQVETFGDAVDLADALTKEVTGLAPQEFATRRSTSRTMLEADTCYVMEFERINAARSLLELYDHMQRTGERGLASRLVLGAPGKHHERDIHVGDGLLTRALAACGSMSDGFPLTPSQRRAVHGFLTDGDGDVTAVSGPPGTGKTTMLQAVVASTLTRRALDEEPPPLIVGTSTNNQAVTNIIDAFASVTKEEPGPLDHRWLPQAQDGAAGDAPMTSLAVYCPSKAKWNEAAHKYLVEDDRRAGVYADHSDEAYLEAARDRFVTKAFAYFGSASDVAGLRTLLHEALCEVDETRRRLLATMATEGPGTRFADLCQRVLTNPLLSGLEHLTELSMCRDLESLDAELDRTLRYAAFWLAVHYYEASWLDSEFLSSDERWKNTRRAMDTYWSQAPALTPCFVMTAYQVPKYFALYAKTGEPRPFDIGRIDLLIVDEAGQVDTPVGLPPFALAKRALVVGDTKQLAPVWSLDDVTDQEVAGSTGVSGEDWDRLLKPRGLTCSQPSSLMAAASNASQWVYGEVSAPQPGLFLAEHFRCHPRIIGLCNELLYDGLLNPRRKEEQSPLHGVAEPFQFREVPDSSDTREGTSRKNVAEAGAIARWVVDNFDALHEVYIDRQEDPNKRPKPEEIIGVVTPFSAQARAVRTALRQAMQSLPAGSHIPSGLAEALTVGTAHRLQGAERPVILFSAVYGQSEGTASFIDGNPELLNVAVSRAKDLLVVFGAERRWNNGPAFSLISQYATRTTLDIGEEPEPPAEPQPLVPTPEPTPTDTVGQPADLPVREKVSEPVTTSTGGSTRMTFATLREANPAPEPGSTSPTAPEAVGEAEKLAEALPVSGLLKQWASSGQLLPEDSGLTAAAFNLRLHTAGILAGEPGAWTATAAGEMVGVTTEPRTGRDGSPYDVILYGPQAQEGLLRLYRTGRL